MISLIILTPGAQAATLTVGPGQAYTTIQSAIDVANAGDTIEVMSGIYVENVVVNRTVALEGIATDGTAPVVNGNGGMFAVEITSNDVVFRGFNVTNATLCILVTSNNTAIVNNQVSGSAQGSIRLENAYYCLVSGNVINNSSSGIVFMAPSYYNNISYNTIFNITQTGISVSSANNIVANNTVYDCRWGLYDPIAANNTITGNTFNNNSEYGAYIYTTDSIVADNTADNNTWYGFYVYYGGSSLYKNNTMRGNQYGIYAYCSKSNAFVNNSAINNSYCGIFLSYNSNDSIIADNTVNGNGDGIYLNGGSSNNTVARNTAEYNNDSGIVLWGSVNNTLPDNVATGSLNGFYGGNANFNNFSNNTASHNSMFGYRLDGCFNNSIANGTISYNDVGIRASNNTSLSNNSIAANTNEGVYVYYASGVNVSGNRIQSNKVGINVYKSDNSTVDNNTIFGSTGNGIDVDQSSNNIILRNNINTNAGEGIYVSNADSNNIRDNAIESNYNGIHFYISSNNDLSDNRIHANANDGIYFYAYSGNNRITENSITNNPGIGINIQFLSDNNVMWLNSLYDNGAAAYVWYSDNNHWNSTGPLTYTIGSASFTNYTGNRWGDNDLPDTNDDGIGDMAYPIDAAMDNVDYYPMYLPGAITPSFTYYQPYAGDPFTVQFIDTSSGYRRSWMWDFGDSSGVEVIKDPLHTFAVPGTYNVRMLVENDTIGYDYYEDVTVPMVSSEIITDCNTYGDMGSDGWYAGDVSIEFPVTGGSGTVTTHFSFDNVTWEDYPGQLYVTDDGVTRIYYYSTDIDGYVEPVRLAYVKIERTWLSDVYCSSGTITGYGSVDVTYTLNDARSHQVYLQVYDLYGNLIRTDDLGLRDSGSYTATWSGNDYNNNFVGDGLYHLWLKVSLDNGTYLSDGPIRQWSLFPNLQGIAVDPSGNVFVTDTSDNSVKKIYPNGTITFIDGAYSNPNDIAADNDGNVYVSNGYYAQINKIWADGHTTVPYYGSYTYSIAPDTHGNIYFSNYSAINVIYANGSVEAHLTGLIYPTSIAVDTAGNVYYNDHIDNTIKKRGPDNTILQVYNFSNSVYYNRLAVDASGNLFIYDHYNDTLTEYYNEDLPDRAIPFSHGYIRGMKADPAGNLYVTTANNEIYEIYANDTAALIVNRAGQPSGAAFDSDDNLYVSNVLSSGIDRIHPDGIIDHPGSEIYGAGGIAVTGSGNSYLAYVAETDTGEIKIFDHLGQTTTIGTGFDHPCGVAADDAGNVYVANTGGHSVNMINTDSVTTQLGGYFERPTGVAVDPLGNVYVVDSDTSEVKEIYANGSVIGLYNELYHPYGIAIDEAGVLYVTSDDRLEKIYPDGTYSIQYMYSIGMQAIAVDPSGCVGVTAATVAYKFAPELSLDQTFNVTVDNDGPNTWPEFMGAPDISGNYIDNVTIDLYADDTGSGVNAIYYNIDQGESGPWEVYDGTPIFVSDPGSHDIYYYATDNNGNDGWPGSTYFVIVGTTLHSSFTTDVVSGEAPLGVWFTSTSMGDITLEQWEFNDGTGGTQDHDPGHVFNDPGTYMVSLTVYDVDGNSDTNSTTIYVSPEGSLANFEFTPGEGPFSIQFSDLSTGTVTGRDWDFGDGSDHDGAQSPYHEYPGPGTYHVTLITTYDEGSSLYSTDVTVNEPTGLAAGIALNRTYGQAPLDVYFTDISSGNIISRTWDFGDGDTSGDYDVVHTFSAPGDYLVTLTVSDGIDTDSANITIHALRAPGLVTNTRTGYISTSIEDVIGQDNTLDGDTIQIDSGSYYEQVNVNKSLTLLGNDDGGGRPVVDGFLNMYATPITLSADGVVLDGLEVTDFQYTGIQVEANDCVLNNIYTHGGVQYGLGINLNGANHTTISDYAAADEYAGIETDNSCDLTIHNAFMQNMTGYGINGRSINHTRIDNVNMTNVGWGIWLYTLGQGNVSYLNNITITNSAQDAVAFGNYDDVSVIGLYVKNISAVSPGNSDLDLQTCNNVTISDYHGEQGYNGIWAPFSNIISISDCTILSHEQGIAIGSDVSCDWNVMNVTIDGGWNGLYLDHANNITIGGARVNNTTWNGFYGVGFNNSTITGLHTSNTTHNGIKLFNSYNVTIADSQALTSGVQFGSNMACYNFTNSSHILLKDSIAGESPYAPGVYLSNTFGSNITNVTATSTSEGVVLADSHNNNVTDSTANDGNGGISLYASNDNSVTGNQANNNNIGIGLYFDNSNNIIAYNVGDNNNWFGLYTIHSSYNRINDNEFRYNDQDGMYITSTNFTDVSANDITNNTAHGILMNLSSGNTFWLNRIAGNGISVEVNGGSGGHRWNSTSPLEYTDYNGISQVNYTGNYWGGYTGYDDNEDGIGDSPYAIDLNNVDLYPMLPEAPAEHIPLAADFMASVTSGDSPLTVQFNDTSIGTNLPDAWSWVIDNTDLSSTAYTGNSQNFSFTFLVPGNYTVYLTVDNTTTSESSTSAAQSISVSSNFAASYTRSPASGFSPLSVQFNDTSSGNNGPDTWNWEIYDSNNILTYTNSSQNYTYTFLAPGIYNVYLGVSNSTTTESATAASQSIDVTSALSAGFTTDQSSGTAPLSVVFNDTSAGSPTSWDWSIDNASGPVYSTTSQHFSYQFLHPDTYMVTLTVQDAYLHSSSISHAVDVWPVLSADFESNVMGGVAPVNAQFIDTSTGYPASWQWTIYDPGNNPIYGSSSQNISYSFDLPGTYTVMLQVNNGTRTDSISKLFTVDAQASLVAGFTADPTGGAAPLTVQFNDTSMGGPTSWEWDFSDTIDNITTQNVTHTFLSPGTYTVILTVTNGSLTSTATGQIFANVPIVPVAGFSANITRGIAPVAIRFTDASTGVPDNWTWDFGDGNTSTIQSPVHLYSTPGLYTVSLMVSNTNGSNTIVMSDYINVTASLLDNGEFHAGLLPGWNLVSFPLDNSPLWASDLNGTGVQEVAVFNTSTGRYDIYMMNDSSPVNDIPILPGVGYFIWSDGTTEIDIPGSNPTSNTFNLHVGWNLVGWNSPGNTDAMAIVSALTGSQQVVRYNIGTGFFQSYVEGISPDDYNFAIQPGIGYFVYTDTAQQHDFGGV